MDNINILEELNRIKFLLSYETGKLISEQKQTTVSKEVTDAGTKTKKVTTEPIKIGPITQDIKLKSGESNVSTEDFKTFTDTIMGSINKNPETQKMLSEKNIQLTSIDVIGGASNKWTKKTGYDLENDRKTPAATPPTDSEYKSNKKLAIKRANIFSNRLINFFTQQGIVVNKDIPKKATAYVINTGGFNDDDKDRNTSFNPGQFVSVTLSFNYVRTTTVETFEPRFDPKYIVQGSYNCNGIAGNGNKASISQVAPGRCESNGFWQIPSLKGKPYQGTEAAGGENSLAIYEIKYNQQLSTDLAKKKMQMNTSTYPAMRWNFIWREGFIEKISFEMNGAKSSDNIVGTAGMDVLKRFMNLPKYSPDTQTYSQAPTLFEQSVQSFLKK